MNPNIVVICVTIVLVAFIAAAVIYSIKGEDR